MFENFIFHLLFNYKLGINILL